MGGRRSKPRAGVAQRNQRAAELAKALEGLPRAQCLTPDKERYRSRKHAETAAEKQWLTNRRLLSPYACSDHYHLSTHRPIKGDKTLCNDPPA